MSCNSYKRFWEPNSFAMLQNYKSQNLSKCFWTILHVFIRQIIKGCTFYSAKNRWSGCWNGSSVCCNPRWHESHPVRPIGAGRKMIFRVTTSNRHCWIWQRTRPLWRRVVILVGGRMGTVHMSGARVRMVVGLLSTCHAITAIPAMTKVGTARLNLSFKW